MPITIVPELAAFILGACIGSFLNVCIYRVPLAKSIVTPGSMCPHCGNPIRFYDNIPIFSYLWLRGRCRQCQAPVSLRYPLVELLTALLFTAVVIRFGVSVAAAIYMAFSAAMVTITFIDIDHRIIPDRISLPGIPLCFLAALALPDMGWKAALIGILVGGGTLFVVAWGYSMLTGKEGMGGGDIKLLAMIGALLGWQGVVFTIFLASLLGTVVGLGIMLYARSNMKLAVPFGPFLAAGALAFIFVGPELVTWYFGLMR
jgi:leader peptidase (prepilin peptidase)/N-methyltransferase